MPSWDELGRSVAVALPDYEYTNALESLSAYSHEYSRVKLVEALSSALHTTTIQPGSAHEEFCQMPFEQLVTTNWDFLLEETYSRLKRYCMPLLSEDQLAVVHSQASVKLLKLHGDLHHPSRMVITEDDYDAFLAKYPLLATYLSSLLIDNTAFFIGYSLDDPDFRQVWQVVKERLGGLRRPAYVLQIGSASHARARFERRGVKVINLPKISTRSYGETLSIVFRELREYWSAGIIALSTSTEPEPQSELALPANAQSRLAFFSVPTRHAALYKEHIYPIAERWGFTPVMAIDVAAPGDNLMAKVYALINKSAVILFDLRSPNTWFEAGLTTVGQIDPRRIILIAEDHSSLPSALQAAQVLQKPDPTMGEEWSAFLETIDGAFMNAFESISSKLDDEPRRLLEKREYRAAVLASFSLLEHELRRLFEQRGTDSAPYRRVLTLGSMLQNPEIGQILGEDMRTITAHTRTRNAIAHSRQVVSGKSANKIVSDVSVVVDKVRELIR